MWIIYRQLQSIFKCFLLDTSSWLASRFFFFFKLKFLNGSLRATLLMLFLHSSFNLENLLCKLQSQCWNLLTTECMVYSPENLMWMKSVSPLTNRLMIRASTRFSRDLGKKPFFPWTAGTCMKETWPNL